MEARGRFVVVAREGISTYAGHSLCESLGRDSPPAVHVTGLESAHFPATEWRCLLLPVLSRVFTYLPKTLDAR